MPKHGHSVVFGNTPFSGFKFKGDCFSICGRSLQSRVTQIQYTPSSSRRPQPKPTRHARSCPTNTEPIQEVQLPLPASALCRSRARKIRYCMRSAATWSINRVRGPGVRLGSPGHISGPNRPEPQRAARPRTILENNLGRHGTPQRVVLH